MLNPVRPTLVPVDSSTLQDNSVPRIVDRKRNVVGASPYLACDSLCRPLMQELTGGVSRINWLGILNRF